MKCNPCGLKHPLQNIGYSPASGFGFNILSLEGVIELPSNVNHVYHNIYIYKSKRALHYEWWSASIDKIKLERKHLLSHTKLRRVNFGSNSNQKKCITYYTNINKIN